MPGWWVSVKVKVSHATPSTLHSSATNPTLFSYFLLTHLLSYLGPGMPPRSQAGGPARGVSSRPT